VRKTPVRSEERERFWRELVEGQQRSGVSIRQWCQRHGVSEPSFYFWRRELAQRSRHQGPQLVPVEVSPSPASRFDLEIELPGRVMVRVGRGCDAELLRQTLSLLFGSGQEAEPC
jgi:transposase-like protein